MKFLEDKVGDSAEKHWKEILDAKKKLGSMDQAISQCAKQEHHSSLEKRMEFVEKELGESADKHDKHKTSMEDRMEFLEANHGDLHKVVAQCAKTEHASSMDKRLGFLENMVG